MDKNVFSPLNLITESGSSFSMTDVTIDTVVAKEENYFVETLSFLASINEEFNTINKIFYRSVLESDGDPIVIQESFADFFSKFKAVIKKFLTFIQSLFQRFITNLNSMVKSQSYLLKHKKDFDRFNSDDNFDIDGYEYTFNTNVPIIDLPIDFSSNLIGITGITDTVAYSDNTVFGDMSKVSVDSKVTDKIKASISNTHAAVKTQLDGSFYDTQRGKVLGLSTNITDDEYSDECWKIYRNGENSTVYVTVNRAYITDALKRIENYKKFIKDVESTRNKIDKKYHDLEKQVEKMVKSNKVMESDKSLRTVEVDMYGSITNVNMSADALGELNAYLKTITSVVQELSNIHSIAFSAKLQAIKDQYVQDKTALYRALSKCQTASKIRAAKEGADLVENIEEEGKLWII